ncbi:MAG: DUF998 domain-containing protein [Gammaproteobacteria bacterium]|nr:DUF998 domain-containing protein [Gammaproteobacteria bacterium]
MAQTAVLSRLVIRAGLACGFIAPVWWALIIAYSATQFPGYSHLTNFISELAARGSPTQALMRNAGFIFTGALYVIFALALGWRFRRDWRAAFGILALALGGAARIGAGLYPCEPGCDPHVISLNQEWHGRFAEAGYWLMMLAAVLWGVVGNRYARLRHLMALGIGTAAWCATALVLMYLHAEWQGLFQRLASGILSLWVVVFATAVWRLPADSDRVEPVAFAPAGVRLKRRERRAAARRRVSR